MAFPERLQQRVERHPRRVVGDQHHFGVAGFARTHFAIGRVRRVAAGIADRGGLDARDRPELAFRAPEAAHAELHGLQAAELAGDRAAVHVVRVAHRHRRVPAGQRAPGRPCVACGCRCRACRSPSKSTCHPRAGGDRSRYADAAAPIKPQAVHGSTGSPRTASIPAPIRRSARESASASSRRRKCRPARGPAPAIPAPGPGGAAPARPAGTRPAAAATATGRSA